MKYSHEKEHFYFGGKYLRSGVYGGLDGIVTTFAVVAGVIGANLSSAIILILGFANLIADGISMAVGDYLSTKSEGEYYKKEFNTENKLSKANPKNERKLFSEILKRKGYSSIDANKISLLVSKNKKFLVDSTLREEIGFLREDVAPGRNAIITFLSFIVFGFLPLVLFVIGAFFGVTIPNAFLWASVLSGVSLFCLGAVKSKITGQNWIGSGAITLLVGGIAAIAAYFVGEILARIV